MLWIRLLTRVKHARRLATSGGRRALELLAAVLPATIVTGCALSRPFQGPGFDPARGVTASCSSDTVVVGLTHAKLDGAKRGPFDDNRDRIVGDLANNNGFIGYSLRTRVFGNEVWTMTAWCSMAALDAFVASRAHQRGIHEGMPAVTRARFARIEVHRSEVPISWKRALAELEQQSAASR